MEKVDVKQVLTADAHSCEERIAPPKSKHLRAGLDLFAAEMFTKSNVTGLYYMKIAYCSLSLRQALRKLYRDGALKKNVAPV